VALAYSVVAYLPMLARVQYARRFLLCGRVVLVVRGETEMRCVGIDPGSHNAALVCLDVPNYPDNAREVAWVGSKVIHPTAKQDLTKAENDVAIYLRAVNVLDLWAKAELFPPDERELIIVLEEPYDAKPFWGAGRRTTGHATGTLFGVGRAYGLLLAASYQHAEAIYSYPVANDRKQERRGWMQGYAASVTPRALTIAAMRGLSKTYGASHELTEDECMALGVLHYHIHNVEKR
jgi:hypothetical protein